MIEFLWVAVPLMVVASLFVLYPVMMHRSQVAVNRKETNIELFKQRIAELQAEYDNDQLSQEQYNRLKTELERRLLEEAENTHANTSTRFHRSPLVGFTLALLIPVIALVFYQRTGALADWQVTQTLNQASTKMRAGEFSSAEVDQLIQQLNDIVERRPDNMEYLMLLANTEMQRQNFSAATRAFQQLSGLVPNDSKVQAQYAQALYLSSGRKLTDQVMAVSSRALAINPDQPTVLGMLGIASFESAEYQQAINYWQRLLPALAMNSPNRKMIQSGIDRAKQLLAANTSGSFTESDNVGTDDNDTAPVASLQVKVSVAEGIPVDSSASVFVYAKALNGPKMPLAVARLNVSDLPAAITLDDSMAMAPGMNLSSFAEVEIVARISVRGIANSGSGDIEGRLAPISIAQVKAPLSLTIDRILP